MTAYNICIILCLENKNTKLYNPVPSSECMANKLNDCLLNKAFTIKFVLDVTAGGSQK